MVREFKKTGVAAALTGALLATASMSSQATVQLSAPGDVVLVPFVMCDTPKQVNTMVGLITFYKERMGLGNGTLASPYLPAPYSLAIGSSNPNASTLLPNLPAVSRSAQSRVLHWYFYNNKSEHLLDGIIPVTDNDFVRFDWCGTLRSLNQLGVYGDGKTPGYMIFVDNLIDRAPFGSFTVPSFALYGHSYQIAGNWATQAFIPVLANPIYSIGPNPTNPSSSINILNVEKRGGYPAFKRLVVGSDFTDTSVIPALRQRDVYMRYFLDPDLAVSNSMVFWFNNNQPEVRASVPGETYDSEQNYLASFSIPLPGELNIIPSTPGNPAFPGMLHSEAETYGEKFTVKNTGIVRFGVPEIKSNLSFTSSGVSFNMLGLAPAQGTVQIQTEMATEGADYFLF